MFLCVLRILQICPSLGYRRTSQSESTEKNLFNLLPSVFFVFAHLKSTATFAVAVKFYHILPSIFMGDFLATA